MRQTSSYFFALPVDIYDAIYSSNRQFPMHRLREYALSKGILVSPHLTREQLCMRIAKLAFSHNEFHALSETLKPNTRKPKSEATDLSRSIKVDEIQKVFNKLKNNYPNDKLTITQTLTGTTVIKSEYDEFDHGQTRLKQRLPKEISIEISSDEKTNTGKIINSATNHAQKIVNSLIELVDQENDTENKIVVERINLIDFSSKQINTFFVRLANTMKGLPFATAVSVKVQRATQEDDFEDDEDDEDKENAEGTLLTTINSAAVSGSNILNSRQVKEFLSDGEYFIYLLRWETEEVHITHKGNCKLLLEIKARLAKESLDFQFDVAGYKHLIKGTNEFVKYFSPLDHIDKAPFIKVLHARAFEVFQEVKDEVSVA